MHLATAAELAAHRYPSAEAIVTPGRRLSFAELDARSSRVACGLAASGLGGGHPVALVAADPAVFAPAWFGIHKAGGVAVPLSTRWKSGELRFALADCRARAILYDEAAAAQVSQALAELGREDLLAVDPARLEGWMRAPVGEPPRCDRSPESPGTILYTSGTTGRPKGVIRTHRSDYLAALSMIVLHRWEPFERLLGVMPLYHTMGLSTLLTAVILNGAFLWPGGGGFDPALCLAWIQAERVTALYLVPTAFLDLATCAGKGGAQAPRVAKLAYAGAPMAEALVRVCLETFRPEVFINHYGCTEMHAITVNPALAAKPSSAGRPALHSRIRLVRPDPAGAVSPEERVEAGQVGEVACDMSSPQAFDGYLDRPEAQARAVRGGWYFTGDLGRIDPDGELHLVGRLDDLIISGGVNIYPAEVERVLAAHPLVREAAVVGTPDEHWGQQVAAFVVAASPSLTAAELDAFCLESPELAAFKRPRRYLFVDRIPKTPSGKVLRTALREQVASEGAGGSGGTRPAGGAGQPEPTGEGVGDAPNGVDPTGTL